jgi:hypothetical protein
MILPRVYSVEEANALVPLLQEAFERLHDLIARAQAVRAKSESKERKSKAAEGAGLAPEAASAEVRSDLHTARETARGDTLRGLERQIEAELLQLHKLGVILKSFEPGIVDVWSQRGGEWVFLCWRLGEDRFSHWHGVNDGFAGRRPVDDEEFSSKYPN